MNFTGPLFSDSVYLYANLLALAGVLMAGWRAPWRMLNEPAKINAWLGASLVVAAFWLLKAGVKPHLDLHLLGATALTLMVGPWFALLGMAIVIASMAYMNALDPQAIGLNWLVLAVVPVWVSFALLRLAQKWLPLNYFVYLFVNAFLGAALAMCATAAVSVGALALAGAYPLDFLLEEFLPYFLLLSWAEAFNTGLAITLVVVYRPQWSVTFDDRLYLNSKR